MIRVEEMIRTYGDLTNEPPQASPGIKTSQNQFN